MRGMRGLLLAGMIGLVGAAPLAGQGVGLEIGTVPDGAVVEDLAGDAVDLGDYVGQGPTLIEFWATWCPQCEELAPEVRRAHDAFGERVEFLIVGVGINQNPRTMRRHLQEHPMPGRILFDARGRATRAFRAPTTSYVVILDAEGRVAYTGVGADQELTSALRSILSD